MLNYKSARNNFSKKKEQQKVKLNIKAEAEQRRRKNIRFLFQTVLSFVQYETENQIILKR